MAYDISETDDGCLHPVSDDAKVECSDNNRSSAAIGDTREDNTSHNSDVVNDTGAVGGCCGGYNGDGSMAQHPLRSHRDNDAYEHIYASLHREILQTIQRYSDTHNIPIKFRHDAANHIIHIAGPQATPRARAAEGIKDAADLAQSTAEHHPYWGLLYHSVEIAEIVLEMWHDAVSKDHIEDMRWSLREMNTTLDRIARQRGMIIVVPDMSCLICRA